MRVWFFIVVEIVILCARVYRSHRIIKAQKQEFSKHPTTHEKKIEEKTPKEKSPGKKNENPQTYTPFFDSTTTLIA